MVNKNLEVDSHIVNWSGVEVMCQGLFDAGSLFLHPCNSDNLELNFKGFSFNALNIVF